MFYTVVYFKCCTTHTKLLIRFFFAKNKLLISNPKQQPGRVNILRETTTTTKKVLPIFSTEDFNLKCYTGLIEK